jgi:hypothetical protein
MHEPTLHTGGPLLNGDVLQFLVQGLEQLHGQLRVRHLSPAEANGDLDLVALRQQAARRTMLDLEVMIVNLRTHGDFPQLDNLAPGSSFSVFLVLFVLVTPEIHHAADWRIRSGGNFHQIPLTFFCQAQSIPNSHDAQLAPFVIDDAYVSYADLLINSQFLGNENLPVLTPLGAVIDRSLHAYCTPQIKPARPISKKI